MDIIQAHAIKNLCYITNRKMIPAGVVVHSTGANNPYLKRYVDCPDQVGVNQYGNHWNTAKPGGRQVCVHAFIGYDKDKTVRVAEILPLTICCWGVGKGKKGSYNYDPPYIQFEICEDGLKDKTYYDEVFSVAAEYTAHLCRTYGLSVGQIVSHKEAHKNGYGCNHGDPEHWMKKFGDTMDDFRRQVSQLLGNTEDEEKTQDTESSQIRDGDLVSIANDAVYYSGKKIPSWVKKQRWFVKGNSSTDRIVIDKSESGKNAICSAINKKYLTVVKAAATGDMAESIGKMETKNDPYLVKITAEVLNIRKGAGTNTAKTGAITDKGVYTIVEEKDGPGASKWGKLKSGAGWISLDFAKKL